MKLIAIGPSSRKLLASVVEVLHETAKQPCHRRNCGTVCKCAPCHARFALEQLDPAWRP